MFDGAGIGLTVLVLIGCAVYATWHQAREAEWLSAAFGVLVAGGLAYFLVAALI